MVLLFQGLKCGVSLRSFSPFLCGLPLGSPNFVAKSRKERTKLTYCIKFNLTNTRLIYLDAHAVAWDLWFDSVFWHCFWNRKLGREHVAVLISTLASSFQCTLHLVLNLNRFSSGKNLIKSFDVLKTNKLTTKLWVFRRKTGEGY